MHNSLFRFCCCTIIFTFRLSCIYILLLFLDWYSSSRFVGSLVFLRWPASHHMWIQYGWFIVRSFVRPLLASSVLLLKFSNPFIASLGQLVVHRFGLLVHPKMHRNLFYWSSNKFEDISLFSDCIKNLIVWWSSILFTISARVVCIQLCCK